MYQGQTPLLKQLQDNALVNSITLLIPREQDIEIPEGLKAMKVDGFYSSDTMRKIADSASTPYIFIAHSCRLTLGYGALKRMISVATNLQVARLYADYYSVKDGKTIPTPLTDCFFGSVRDDFNFGHIFLFSVESMKQAMENSAYNNWKYSAWYDLHLGQLRNKRHASIFHLREYLYTMEETDLRKSGEKQFDYVDPRNREVQIEREQVFTRHLQSIGAYIPPYAITELNLERAEFDIEASVIIPVRNRVRTIADAVKSALAQETSFPFNVIVVDNHSTDGTTEILHEIAKQDSRLVVIVPEETDLGIGGCWSKAINDSRCGRFAVQLDSDDLYSGTDTISRIVDKFYAERCAMVIGSYRMCNFQLETLPPGIIDHKEWTDDNGRNNALRINGLGAPRAFYVPLLRKIGVPNTSYGEDYALGLAFSRKYKIGRIYDELYLCRRWEGNSDAALSQEKINQNNLYKDSLRTMELVDRLNLNAFRNSNPTNESIQAFFNDQLSTWSDAAEHYRQLNNIVSSNLEFNGYRLSVQWNPARIVSTSAKIDASTIAHRPCFLCDINRPDEQKSLPVLGKYEVLVNPYPIIPQHFTVPLMHHQNQAILGHYEDMLNILLSMDNMLMFYNGPHCGASCPDHMHFQACSRGIVPLERDWDELYRFNRSRIFPVTCEEFVEASQIKAFAEDMGIYSLRGYACPAFIIVSNNAESGMTLFKRIYDVLPIADGEEEPRMNILAWTYASSFDGTQRIVSIIIPRTKHRPDCYYAEGDEQMLISPGALDMAGLIITPRECDFKKLTPEIATDIISECGISLDEETALIHAFKHI